MHKILKLRIGIAVVFLMIAGTVSFVGGGFAAAAAGDISGTVFDDVNEDGAKIGELGIAGVTATAYDASGASVGSATTDANGNYTISGLNNGEQYRIEFTNLPANYTDGPVGTDSETSVTFATPETSGVDFGAIQPETCPQPPANALLYTYAAAVSCSAVVDPAYPKDSYGLLDISSTVPASGSVDQTASTPMFHHPDWHIDQIGNIYGTAIDNTRGDFFGAASSNYSQLFYTNIQGTLTRAAIVQYGAIGGGADDLGAAGTVYIMDAVTGAPSVFAQLPQQSTTFNHIDCESNETEARTTGVGLGNIVYDTANDQIFVANWEDGHIYRLAMNGAILDAYDVDVDDDGTPGMANGDVPYALETSNDGTRLYWGTVLGREVWSVDLTAAGGFTGTSSVQGGVSIFKDSSSETLNQVIPVSTAGEPDPTWLNNNLMHFVSDLEILPSGEMMAGLRVGCSDNPHGAYNHQGQTHLLTDNGAGIYSGDAGALDISATGDAGLDDNYGGVDFYNNPNTGTTQYAATSADILQEAGPHGLAVFASPGPGGVAPLGAIDYGTPNDPKGLAGDVSILNLEVCTPSDIEIGNYVWLDLDGDGIQDPDELPLEGVTVTLYAADGVTVIATTTTDANGEYYFDTGDGVDPNTSYVIGFDVTTTTSTLPAGATPNDLMATVADTGNPSGDSDLTDSDLVGTTIAVTTGDPGDNDHSFDAGFSLSYDLALTKVYTSDTFGNTTDGVIQNGTDVTFTIEVTNQGALDATTFDVTDYLPAGFTLNDPNWTDNGDGTATISAGPLLVGDSTQIPITLTATSAADGDLVNWAEISADDGNDVDSTPDADPADDNQPAAPGDPTDDVIDNTPDANGDPDSDDHDPAPITVVSYDLALQKVYTSDSFGNSTDGVIEIGSDVTFTITITNQGTIDATSFDVTDYYPSGFTLNDAAWTDNGDGTATIAAGPLAAGAALDIPITLTATSSGAGDLVNWAEISADDGDDVDSTPDTDPADDNQPAAPGDPTDDVIDNTPDGNGAPDEDDHDPAGVVVEAYDLALQKVFTSDTFGDPNDAEIGNGSDVTFTITVTNQGTLDANTFDVTDYIPAGFVLNDPNWTDNGDGTATISAGPLAAGASTDITITLTANGAADGDYVNWAEISADDGNDVDSTPDTDPADDNQPTGPGDPTDDEINNTPDANGDPDSDDHDPAGVTVGTYDLALAKVYTSDTSGVANDGVIEDGADVTFTITVTNQGTLDAATFAVTDYIPSGFTLNDAAWTDNGDGTATQSGGPLAAGASATMTITLTASGVGTGDFVNWAEISTDDGNDVDSTPDTDPANDNQPAAPGDPTDDVVDNTAGDEDDHDPAGVTVANYDLALTKVYTFDSTPPTADGVIEPGNDVIFTITVTNQGTTDAATFDVTDYLPAGFTLNDPNWTDNGDGTATISGGPLPAGDSTDITIRLTASTAPTGDHVNWAEISADDGNDVDSTPDADPNDDNQPAGPGEPTDDVIDNTAGDSDDHDPAGITIATYDLALQKVYTSDTFANTTDGIIENGADVTFTITVTNQGSTDATTFDVTDYLPAGFTLNDAAWTDNGDGTATIAAGPLAAGATLDIPITLTATSAVPGTLENWAEISADDGNDLDSTTDADQSNDNQPAAPGAPTDDVIDNTAGDEDDHDVAGVTIANYDLALVKVYTSDTFGNTTDGVIENGTDVTFTITVTNQGTLDANTFDVTDYIPAGFVLNDPNWTDNGDGTATISAGPLAAGASTDITITLTANGAADGDYVNWAEISADDGNDIDSTPDADPADDNQPGGPGDPTDDVVDNTSGDEDDHDPAPITVASYDLALIKVYTSDTYEAPTDGIVANGFDVTHTITVTNQGTIDATTFTITDYLPAGFVLNDPAWTDNGDGTASITAGPLAAGATLDITITLTADSAATGQAVNWAEISADDGNDSDSTPDTDQTNDNQPPGPDSFTDDVIDGTAGDEDDHDPSAVVVAEYDLALVKVYTSDTSGASTDGQVEAGGDVTFTITVTNQGTIDATNFDVTDYIPTGFTLNDPAWTDNGDGTATTTAGPLAAGASLDVTITMTAGAIVPGVYVNWAEISDDDGIDVDSTPDTDQANDNQPTGPGDATDNVVDNTAGDEDDQDPAGVTLTLYDLALQKVYTSDTFANTTDGIIEDGADVTFTITVTNQGTVDAQSFDVTDYLPAGFVLNDAAWTDNGDGTATITLGPLPAGQDVSVPITMTANGVVPGTFENWAEISADDGNDPDSTPDTDQSNDNQPATAGAPTDDVIDNTPDGNGAPDEDDHDVAAVAIANYDLALTKAYTSDNFGNATDGVIENGTDVTFTITVYNQGTLDANTFDVTDYLPAGFVLNDPNWTDNGDGTATISAGPVAAGTSTNITITLTATGAPLGDHVNWAEISADDGNDVDSTPDTDPADDNQPGGPGDPTDDVVDNTAGDSDDHDPAGVTVANYDLALTKVYTSDTFGNATDGVIVDGSDVTFTIEVTNQGTIDAATFDVTDYIPAGFVLSGTQVNGTAWTDNGDGTATHSGGPLAAGASTTMTITLTATGAADGDHVNWAEISADDGNDVDSTPDTDQTNDNQPTSPGDPTDDVIDNTSGDEDDHDPAGVSVANYDLALVKVYTSDTFDNPTDGVVQAGTDVTFTITVTNQGTLDATTFDVTDYIPAGFVLNDGAWTDNGDGTATISAGPLAAGASTDIAIVLTAQNPTVGDAVNGAEISADDGADVDSTPDGDPADDNQPAAPGDPTDDVIDNSPDGNGAPDEDDHDIAGLTVVEYDLALIKAYTSDTFANATDGVIENGADVTFTITVTNQGTIDATSFTITDYLPAGFVLNDAAWTDNGDGTASINAGPLAAGASADITITLTATTATPGDSINWAEISDDDGNDVDSTPDTDPADDNQPGGPGDPTDGVIDNTAGDEDDHDPAGVQIVNYDLALTKAYTSDTFGSATDGVIENGSDVTFTITITNQGTVDANTFDVTDYIPAGFVLNDPNWTDNGDGTATQSGGPLAAGASTTMTITLTATTAPTGDHVNWAEISADDGNDVDSTPDTDPADDNQPGGPGDPTDDVIDNTSGDEDDHDPAGVTVEVYDLALQKVYTSDTFDAPADGVIDVGANVTFTITVTNQGTIDATSFDVTDYLPAGFVLNDAAWTDNGDGTATISGGPLAAGASTDITITMTATAVVPGTYVNWAEISADDGNDADSTPNADPADDNQPSSPGDPTDDVIDNTPDGNGAADEDDHDPAAVGVENFDLAMIKVLTDDGFGDPTDGLTENGADVIFTVTVINQGTIDATTFDVTDYLPAGFVLNDAAWTDNGDGTATISGGPLAAGASTDITIVLTADAAAPGSSMNIAEISSDDGNDIDSTPDSDPADDNQPAAPGDPTDNVTNGADGDSDDHDIAGVTIGEFDLALVKVYTSDTSADGNATDGMVQVGDEVTFTITVTNQGTIDAATFDVTDYIPAGLSLNDAAWTDNGDGTATMTGGPLAPGASVDMTITMTVTATTAGGLVNGAEISDDSGNDVDSTPDTDPADDNQPGAPGDPTDDVTDNTAGDEDDHDIAGLTVDVYDLALVKDFTSDTSADGNATDGVIQVGDDVTFTITVTNEGTVDATSVEVTDYMPPGFVLSGTQVDGTAWTDNGNGTATTNVGAIPAGGSVSVTITMTAADTGAGPLVNWAEISSDDGDDIDSVPNTSPNDDGTPPSEDDIDDAPLTVDAYDLALLKVYTSDNSADGNSTDGAIAAGDDITFTITVINQGTVDASFVEVTDYLPAGTSLNDSAWTDNGDGTASINVGPIAAGESLDVPITLTAVDPTLGAGINIAEISDDDGNDVDSVTNSNDGDDGPVTDGEVNNVAGDQDDHDPAPFMVILAQELEQEQTTTTTTTTTIPPAATTPTKKATPLAVTGTTWTMIFLSWALGLTFLGAALVLFARKPEDDDFAAVLARRSERRR